MTNNTLTEKLFNNSYCHMDLARNKAEMAIKQSANVPNQSVDQSHEFSVADPGSGDFLTPGSGIRDPE
jgi:hypothetical protein